MAEGFQAGSAYVQVLPDFRGFHKSIENALRDEEPTFERFGDTAGKRFVAGFSERLRAGFERLPHASIKADADTRRADEKLDRAARNRKSTILVAVKTVGKGSKDLLGSRLTQGVLAGAALGPTALGLGALGAGAAVAGGAALGGAGLFGILAKSEVKQIQDAQKAITAAQKQYAAAQAKVAAATTPKGRAAALAAQAKASKALAQANAQLTPSERTLGTEITTLTGAWAKLGKAEAPVIASALSPWVKTATSGLGLLKPIVNDVGSAIGFLGDEASVAIKSPFWAKFSSTFGQTAGIGLIGFGHALGHVADGFAHLFVEFSPDIQKIPAFADKAAGSFDRWASSVHRGGLDKFLSQVFAKRNLNTLKGDAQNIGALVGNISRATAQISPAAFLGLSKVLEILSKLSPGQIEAVAALYAVTKIAGGAGNIAKLVGGGASVLGGLLGIGKKAAGAATAGGTGLPAITGGPAAGEAAGAEAGVAFAAAFGEAVTAGLPEAFALIGTEAAAEAGAGGEALGAEAGTAFVTGFGASAGAEFAASIGEIIAAAAIGAGIAGFAVGGAAGAGIAAGFLVSGFLIRRAVGKVAGWVKGAIGDTGNWLRGAGARAAGGFAAGYLSQAGAVRSASGRTHGWVTGGVGDTHGWLFGAGSGIIGGLLRGIQSGIPAVEGLLNWLGNHIPQWKGPMAYDRKLLVPNGRAVMAGFNQGLMEGWQPGFRFVQSIAPKIAGAAPLPGVGRPLNGGQLNLRLTYGSTSDRLTNEIVTALRLDIGAKAGGDAQRHLGQGKART
jgi:hypothetical protein